MTTLDRSELGSHTKVRELKQTIWNRQADALTLSGMLEGLDLMNGEGEQYDEARTAITRAALEKAGRLSADLEKLEKLLAD